MIKSLVLISLYTAVSLCLGACAEQNNRLRLNRGTQKVGDQTVDIWMATKETNQRNGSSVVRVKGCARIDDTFQKLKGLKNEPVRVYTSDLSFGSIDGSSSTGWGFTAEKDAKVGAYFLTGVVPFAKASVVKKAISKDLKVTLASQFESKSLLGFRVTGQDGCEKPVIIEMQDPGDESKSLIFSMAVLNESNSQKLFLSSSDGRLKIEIRSMGKGQIKVVKYFSSVNLKNCKVDSTYDVKHSQIIEVGARTSASGQVSSHFLKLAGAAIGEDNIPSGFKQNTVKKTKDSKKTNEAFESADFSHLIVLFDSIKAAAKNECTGEQAISTFAN